LHTPIVAVFARAAFACAVLRPTYAPFFENKKGVLTKKERFQAFFGSKSPFFGAVGRN
jgi:hypothetical protein